MQDNYVSKRACEICLPFPLMFCSSLVSNSCHDMTSACNLNLTIILCQSNFCYALPSRRLYCNDYALTSTSYVASASMTLINYEGTTEQLTPSDRYVSCQLISVMLGSTRHFKSRNSPLQMSCTEAKALPNMFFSDS